ncbi:MAG: D-alanine--D-alanine ligase [Candidatus Omnitrophota bacterium]
MSGIDILKRFRVGVLAGGPSSEREISLKSAGAVFNALTGLGIDTVLMRIDDEKSDLLTEIRLKGANLIFIALHGRFGEDGTVQELLSGEGIPYTGSGPEASRTALDKLATKRKLAAVGISVPASTSVFPGEDIVSRVREIRVPCVVKPRYEGSSIGLSVVTDPERLAGAVETAFKYGEEVIVENFIPGRELTVGVLDERALPVIEILAAEGVYDYTSKYISSGTKYNVPAEIGKENYVKAQALGLAAHNALGCKSFSRTDLRMTSGGEFYVLEVNTIPGLTEKSLLPMAAASEGVDFRELCVNMLQSALKYDDVKVRNRGEKK